MHRRVGKSLAEIDVLDASDPVVEIGILPTQAQAGQGASDHRSLEAARSDLADLSLGVGRNARASNRGRYVLLLEVVDRGGEHQIVADWLVFTPASYCSPVVGLNGWPLSNVPTLVGWNEVE